MYVRTSRMHMYEYVHFYQVRTCVVTPCARRTRRVSCACLPLSAHCVCNNNKNSGRWRWRACSDVICVDHANVTIQFKWLANTPTYRLLRVLLNMGVHLYLASNFSWIRLCVCFMWGDGWVGGGCWRCFHADISDTYVRWHDHGRYDRIL